MSSVRIADIEQGILVVASYDDTTLELIGLFSATNSTAINEGGMAACSDLHNLLVRRNVRILLARK